MTCMPVFTKDKDPGRPVRWETVWINKDNHTVGRTRKRKPVDEVWKESDGTYRVITLAKRGEQAFMEGANLIEEYLLEKDKAAYDQKMAEAQKLADDLLGITGE